MDIPEEPRFKLMSVAELAEWDARWSAPENLIRRALTMARDAMVYCPEYMHGEPKKVYVKVIEKALTKLTEQENESEQKVS